MIHHTIRRVMLRRPQTADAPAAAIETPAALPADAVAEPGLDIAPTDPIVPFFQSAPGAVELRQLELDSPALEQMRAQGITLVVPLVTQGELIGLLNLGPRLSDQEYSPDDRRCSRAWPPRPRRRSRSASSCASRRSRCGRASGSSRSSRWPA